MSVNSNQCSFADLSGQVALVTGATSGLGWHFAQVLAKSGARVGITGRREEKLVELEKLIKEAGGDATYFVLDIRDAENIVDVVERVETNLGTISILVNNAGIADAKAATKIEVEILDQLLFTNIRGPFLAAREVAKRLIARKKSGRIVNVSSISSFNFNGHGAAFYAATKAAVNRMTEVLAVEWSRFHINVNAIAPGVFYSEMTDAVLNRYGDISDRYPRMRLGQPSQLESTLLYLCSPASECVTGTVIKVDDGQEWR